MVGHLDVKDADGSVSKVSPPTPGWGDDSTYSVAQNMIRCYGLNDNVHEGATCSRDELCP